MVGTTVGMKHQLSLSEKLNVSSCFDSSQDISLSEDLKSNTEINSNLEHLLHRILGKMDEYENKIYSLNNLIIKEKSENASIKNELYNIRNDNNKLNFELTNLNEEIYNMDIRIIENNQYARRESLIISGIPDSIGQNDLEDQVIHILRSIGLTSLTSYNISACHRLYKKNKDAKYPAQTIVRFTNRKFVNFSLLNRNGLLEMKTI